MRRIVLTLLLALLSLAFAPAPFPKSDRQTPRQRGLRECVRRLAQLGVEWSVHDLGELVAVQFNVKRAIDGGQMGGWHPTPRGELLATLQNVARDAERFLTGKRVG